MAVMQEGEGELIFQRVYDLAGCRKPVKRLWISSMEDTAIRTGFQTMKGAEEYRNICMAAVCRAQADWLIGMNGTRAYTTCYFKTSGCGQGADANACHACGTSG